MEVSYRRLVDEKKVGGWIRQRKWSPVLLNLSGEHGWWEEVESLGTGCDLQRPREQILSQGRAV